MSDSAVLKAIIERSGVKVSDSGVAWLGTALNPFSDFQQNLVGYPDANAQPSNVMMYSSQLNVTAPASAAGGNYDCYIVDTAVDCDPSITCGYIAADAHNSVADYTSVGYPVVSTVYPLTVMTGPSGADVSPLSTAGTEVVQGLFSRNIPKMFGRVIAKGFEVSNTTAEIYKQGTVTCAIVPAVPDQAINVELVDTAAVAESQVQIMKVNPRFPVTVSELRTIPQSSQWEAAKGVYFVPRISSSPYIERPDLPTGNYFYDGTHQVVSAAKSGYVYGGKTFPVLSTSAHDTFSTGVAFFQGLSNQTTLTVSFRTVVEYFPDPGSQLITEASPSAVYDPFVLQIYNEAVKVAPFAVPVGQNAAGDFFRKVLGAVRYAAPVIAAAVSIPFPRAGNAVMMAGRMAKASGRVVRKQQKKKKAKRAARAEAPVFVDYLPRRQAGNTSMPARVTRG